MARPTKAEREAAVLERSRCEFDRVQEAMLGERRQCVEDRRFVSIPGAQWEGAFGEMFANKPRLEINKAMLSLIRIYNEYRNNRITVDFVSRDGTENDQLADLCDDLYRADEQDSNAEEAYDNAFDEATAGGFGAWRLRAEYEDEYDPENEKQRICIEPIYDADTSVYFDLDAKRQDKRDAKRCWVIYSMARGDFTEEYEDPASWPKDTNTIWFDWYTPDVVYIAEYYEIEEGSEEVVTLLPLDGEEIKLTDPEDEEVEEHLALGAIEVRRRKIKTRKCHKWLLSGAKVLEDYGYIAGKDIPIIPVYGKRWFIDNIERCMGHVRLVKDAIRVLNMLTSKLAEIAASSSTRKPIFTPEQIAGLETFWADDAVANYPYALVNPITDANGQEMPAGPIAYTETPNIPEALAGLVQLMQADLNELLGNQQQGDQMLSNISGKAVEMIQQRLDMQAFIYLSNFAKGMRRCGEVWLGMAKDLYYEKGRKMKGVGVMGEITSIELGEPIMRDGELRKQADLSEAKFDVIVDVGPSFTSRRDATVRALTGVLQMTENPEDRTVIQSLILMNMEGEGLGEVHEFYRKKLVAMGVLQPTPEEKIAMAEAEQQPPSSEDIYLQTEGELNLARAELAKADIELRAEQKRKTAADADKSTAQAGESRAKTIEILNGGATNE